MDDNLKQVIANMKRLDDATLSEIRRAAEGETKRRIDASTGDLSDIRPGMSAEAKDAVRAEIARVAREMGR
jgi:hypothetical protein